uniref:Anti_prolifrtn domain-containing protein n=1 Tax=Macrostomum lignano TaxID=282301 RepID=A0A1I8FDU1_9PLAT
PVSFVTSFLYGKLPPPPVGRLLMLGEELDKAIQAKFRGHWYPDQPLKGTAYRCLKLSGDNPNLLLFEAAREIGLEAAEILQHLLRTASPCGLIPGKCPTGSARRPTNPKTDSRQERYRLDGRPARRSNGGGFGDSSGRRAGPLVELSCGGWLAGAVAWSPVELQRAAATDSGEPRAPLNSRGSFDGRLQSPRVVYSRRTGLGGPGGSDVGGQRLSVHIPTAGASATTAATGFQPADFAGCCGWAARLRLRQPLLLLRQRLRDDTRAAAALAN